MTDSPLLKQIWMVSAVLINMAAQGMVLSYPTSLLPAVTASDSPIAVDFHTASWLGSIVGAAGVPGLLSSSFLMDIIGRKMTYGVLLLPGITGWLCIFLANSVTALMIGRFLCGFTSNATVALGAIVIGEYTSPEYRGVFLYLKNASVCFGAMISHIINKFLTWRILALVSMSPMLACLAIVYTWPESPSFLLSKQKYEECATTFYYLRGSSDTSRKELDDTIRGQKERILQRQQNFTWTEKIRYILKKCSQKDFLKPFFIMFIATIVLDVSGKHVFLAYAEFIMSAATGESVPPFYYTLPVVVIITCSALVASFLVKIVNRRTLLFYTGFLAVLVLVLVSLYTFLALNSIIPNRPWIPISLLVLYFMLTNLGCVPIHLALIGEIFPLAHRGVGLALSGVWVAISLLLSLKSTPHMIVTIQIYGFFAVCGIIMFVSLMILYFILPETKDKSLQEIEDYFKYGRYRGCADDKEANVKMIDELYKVANCDKESSGSTST